LDDLPAVTGTCVTVAGRDVALFNVDGTIYAMEDSCLHQGLSLGTSKLEGTIVSTDAEWEFAARGRPDGAIFTWGDEEFPDGELMVNAWQASSPGRTSSRTASRVPRHLARTGMDRTTWRATWWDGLRIGTSCATPALISSSCFLIRLSSFAVFVLALAGRHVTGRPRSNEKKPRRVGFIFVHSKNSVQRLR